MSFSIWQPASSLRPYRVNILPDDATIVSTTGDQLRPHYVILLCPPVSISNSEGGVRRAPGASFDIFHSSDGVDVPCLPYRISDKIGHCKGGKFGPARYSIDAFQYFPVDEAFPEKLHVYYRADSTLYLPNIQRRKFEVTAISDDCWLSVAAFFDPDCEDGTDDVEEAEDERERWIKCSPEDAGIVAGGLEHDEVVWVEVDAWRGEENRKVVRVGVLD